MTFKPFVAAALAAASTLAAGSSAYAQAAAAPQVTHGAAVPGLCIISVEGVIANSTVGKYVDTRLQQIVGQVQAELGAERNGIDAEAKTLEGQRASLDQNSFEQRGAALQVRANALQRKAQLRDREVQATEQKALARIGDEMEPLIRQAYQQKNCSVLLQRTSVVLANPAMDITPTVVTALNAKITQFAFDRERLDQAAAAPAAPRPTTPAPAPKPAPKK
ncbi:OmpH family outer membrane protein [Phenylobacterium soli]|uniref:OmpH family outer membrane protein n=1 Tax=Phenylobacterium soli TaxID=2170551 RepID=A0A328AR09_9CAUL|nr:OmpH family outer membrane protein [Phenylobacterium soli]RAK55358.1 OmpH family outer membrane protein [Phenylobacterium soli]